MKKRLTHNLGLKLAALFCACCLWLISMNINDPVTQRIYTVPVQLQNINLLTDAGKYVEVLDDTDTIRVTVRASRSVFSDFSDKNIVAVEINIENMMKMQKRISVNVANAPAEGYLLGNISTDQNAVIITGPESVVDRIASTAVEINVDGATSDVNITLPVHLYDADGHEVEDARLSMSVKEVFTTAAILQTKIVPIEYTAMGTPEEGYVFAGEMIREPENVIIAAKPAVLKNVNSIQVENVLDVSGAEQNVTAQVELKQYLPDNTILADSQFNGTAKVTAVVEEETVRALEIPIDNISVTNIPEGYKAKIKATDDVVSVRVAGLQSQVNALNVTELYGTVDVAAFFAAAGEEIEFEEGTYYPRTTFTLPEYVYVKEGGTVQLVLEEE